MGTSTSGRDNQHGEFECLAVQDANLCGMWWRWMQTPSEQAQVMGTCICCCDTCLAPLLWQQLYDCDKMLHCTELTAWGKCCYDKARLASCGAAG